MTAAPWGFNNDATKESWQTSKLFWAFCLIAACCVQCCDSRNQEVINYYEDGEVSAEKLIN